VAVEAARFLETQDAGATAVAVDGHGNLERSGKRRTAGGEGGRGQGSRSPAGEKSAELNVQVVEGRKRRQGPLPGPGKRGEEEVLPDADDVGHPRISHCVD